MAVATVIAFVVGYAAIAWLLRYIEHHSVYLFVWYRIALGARAVRRARRGVDLGDLSCRRGPPSGATRRLDDRDHPDPAAPRALVGERGRRAGGAHPRRGARRDRGAPRPRGSSSGSPGCRWPRSVSSPALRCEQTVAPLLADRGLTAVTEPGLAEVDYGSWTGRELKKLAEEPLWRVVQAHPSAAVFPDGEGLAGMQARAVAAVRRHDARIAAEHGPRAVWLACSHGDVIKSILADALACHLDNFQRIVVDPCSISVVHYTETRPFVVRVNDLGGDVAGLVPPAPKPGEEGEGTSDAVVGGAAGAAGGGPGRR